MKNEKDNIIHHLIQLGRISDLCSLLEVAARNAPAPDFANKIDVESFPFKLADAFELIHAMMSHHLGMINDAID